MSQRVFQLIRRAAAVAGLVLLTQMSFAAQLCVSIMAAGNAMASSQMVRAAEKGEDTAAACCDEVPQPGACVVDSHFLVEPALAGATAGLGVPPGPTAAEFVARRDACASGARIVSGYGPGTRTPLPILYCRYLN